MSFFFFKPYEHTREDAILLVAPVAITQGRTDRDIHPLQTLSWARMGDILLVYLVCLEGRASFCTYKIDTP